MVALHVGLACRQGQGRVLPVPTLPCPSALGIVLDDHCILHPKLVTAWTGDWCMKGRVVPITCPGETSPNLRGGACFSRGTSGVTEGHIRALVDDRCWVSRGSPRALPTVHTRGNFGICTCVCESACLAQVASFMASFSGSVGYSGKLNISRRESLIFSWPPHPSTLTWCQGSLVWLWRSFAFVFTWDHASSTSAHQDGTCQLSHALGSGM